jgi:hypothetical protein
MITGKTKTEANYRAITIDSSSSLKDFSMDRKKYYRKYILGEKVDEKDNQSINMGKLVETLLMEPEEFDKKFFMSSCASAPTGLMLEFVEALYRRTMEATDDKGVVTRSFEDISRDAYVDSGFKLKYEAILTKFIGSDAEIYYNEIRKVRANDLTVITSSEVTMAETIVEELRTNSLTSPIVNLVNSVRYTVINQMQIENYEIDGLPLKSMLDKVIIDHREKKIIPYDLKCVWAVETFYTEYYLYRRAYIQAYLYHKALLSIVNNPESEYYGYEVQNLVFLICDSTNYYNPLLYTLSEEDMKDAYEGFEHRGREYKGVKEIIEDLKWTLENNIWNISRKNYLSNGIVNIKG